MIIQKFVPGPDWLMKDVPEVAMNISIQRRVSSLDLIVKF